MKNPAFTDGHAGFADVVVGCSEVLIGQVGQLAPLPLVEGDVAEEVAALEPVNHIAHAVGLLVEVGRVNLPDIAREDDLGILASPGDDGLDLVRGQVLGFVDDEDDVGQTPAPDVGEGQMATLPWALISSMARYFRSFWPNWLLMKFRLSQSGCM